uniref:Uncharacterized protein n=1 Tax=Mycena chlorophos TaxID=658473 RepID=A0ABQ0M858_MYCCL|nr:predicted protein [Mycena chlorophos]
MLLATLLLAAVAVAIPTFDGLSTQHNFISNVVPRSTPITAMGDAMRGKGHHLCSHNFDEPGNLTIIQTLHKAPPIFSLSPADQQLWQFQNESTVYPVTVLNTTGPSDDRPFLQLLVGKQPRSANVISGGAWRWSGSSLRYWLGPKTNSGIYYSCPTGGSRLGLFTSLVPGPNPPGCNLVTLHGFSENIQR